MVGTNAAVVVTISPAGLVKIDAQNFTGKACEDATAQIEQVLGGVSVRSSKPERHLPAMPSTGQVKQRL